MVRRRAVAERRRLGLESEDRLLAAARRAYARAVDGPEFSSELAFEPR